MLEINKLTGGLCQHPCPERGEFFSSGWPTDWFDWT